MLQLMCLAMNPHLTGEQFHAASARVMDGKVRAMEVLGAGIKRICEDESLPKNVRAELALKALNSCMPMIML